MAVTMRISIFYNSPEMETEVWDRNPMQGSRRPETREDAYDHTAQRCIYAGLDFIVSLLSCGTRNGCSGDIAA